MAAQGAVPEAAKKAPRAEGIDQRLSGCTFAWLSARSALVGTAAGELLAATLPLEGGSVKRIQVWGQHRTGSARLFLTSTLQPLGNGFVDYKAMLISGK